MSEENGKTRVVLVRFTKADYEKLAARVKEMNEKSGKIRHTISSLIRERTRIDDKEELRRIRIELRQIRLECELILRKVTESDTDGTRAMGQEQLAANIDRILMKLTEMEKDMEKRYGDNESETSEI